MCKFMKSLEDVSVSEWLLLLLAALMSAQLAVLTRDDPENKRLHPFYVLQMAYYLIRSILPVCGFLRDKVEIEMTIAKDAE